MEADTSGSQARAGLSVARSLPAGCRAVEAVCREGPARVLELVKLGADFTRNSGGRRQQQQRCSDFLFA